MTNEAPQWPVHDLNLVLYACDPSEPLKPGDTRYADLSALRQGFGIVQVTFDLLAPLAPGRFHHHCLCGHRGSGKSTELLSLKKWADEQGFLTVLTEVDEHFGSIELAFADLFLLAATVAEKAMDEFKHPLPEQKIRRVVEWFAERIQENQQNTQSEIATEAGAQIGGAAPLGLGKLFAKFTAGIKATSSHALTTRQTIRSYPDTLIDLTNDLLRTANEMLAAQGKPRGLLLLFDNLDRYEPLHVDRVLFQGSELVGRMECHALFTIPIALEYESLSGATQDCYGYPTVLPMLALRRKHQAWAATVADSPFDETAVGVVREALSRRLALDLFEAPQDADLLIKMSGGCVRDLMHLVTLAFRHSGGAAKFTSPAVRKAITQMRASYVRKLNPKDYDYLATIARAKVMPEIEQQLKEKSRLLFNRFALEYLGEDELPWMDTHPVIVETEEFRRAYDKISPLAG